MTGKTPHVRNDKNSSKKGTFVLQATLPQEVKLASGSVQSRDDLLGRLNDFCSSLDSTGEAFLGLTEGVLLAEEAHERGYETESWVLDAGMAPHERDWIAQEKAITIQAYFKTEKAAHAAKSWLTREFQLVKVPTVEFQEEQDWNAQWKASFQGIEVDEGLRVLPPWHEEWLKIESTPAARDASIIAINPGAGFGTGTHETTQLCLRLLKRVARANGGTLNGKTVLDFGSGSGILGITAAKLGAKVFCVEVDPMANENAAENARMNGVEENVVISEFIPDHLTGTADILLANILRPILLQFAPKILSCLKPKSELILSGLIESDLAPVIATYLSKVPGALAKVDFSLVEKSEKGEWRAIYFERT